MGTQLPPTRALKQHAHVTGYGGLISISASLIVLPRWVRWLAYSCACVITCFVCRKDFLRAMIGRLEEDKQRGMAQFSQEEGKVSSRFHQAFFGRAVRCGACGTIQDLQQQVTL